MKKLAIGIVSFLLTVPAIAGGIDCRRGVDHKHPACFTHPHTVYHNHHYHNRPVIVHRNHDWVAPAIIGAIGTAIVIDAMNRRTETQVIVQPVPTVQTQSCGPWVEIQNSDGTVYRQRTCN